MVHGEVWQRLRVRIMRRYGILAIVIDIEIVLIVVRGLFR
jgi:hypothetical protein